MNKKMLLIISFVTCFGLQVEASNQSWFGQGTCTPGDEVTVNVVSALSDLLLVGGTVVVSWIAIKGLALAVKHCDCGDTLMSFVFDSEDGFDHLSGLPGDK
jgi:hypothetical protein